jgi:hypothetical protein
MKNFIILLCFLLGAILSYSQTCSTLVVSDRIEAYDWFGAWNTPGPTWGYYTNAFVSSNASAALYGNGTGSSGIESQTYVLPNITGLLTTNSHIFRFRLSSYRFTSTGATSGVDVPDYVNVSISTNGGVTYVNELRVTGFSNAYWSYASTATASKTANGTLTTFTPTAGGDRTTTGDGYSYIEILIPSGITQIAVRVLCVANSTGEEWWMDDFELFKVEPCVPLPIELLWFEGSSESNYNFLKWATATELNNHFFTLERSIDGIQWEIIHDEEGSGNSNTPIIYEYKDFFFERNITNYYRLSQTDYNGTKEYFNIIAIEDDDIKICEDYEYYDLTGKKVDFTTEPPGLYLRKCGDNPIEKIVKVGN